MDEDGAGREEGVEKDDDDEEPKRDADAEEDWLYGVRPDGTGPRRS